MKRYFSLLPTAISCIMVFCLSACREEIDVEKRYAFSGQTIASFLQDNENDFSYFIEILNRGEQLGLMKAYGTYTCFAPTNEAIERYLVEQDSIWRASLLPGSKKVIWTGITSPKFEELSDSMCHEIARTHILPHKVFTYNMEGDVMPYMNLNNRYLTMRASTDENLHYLLIVNGATIIDGDLEVSNGVVHAISSVLNPSTNTVPAQIEEIPFLSIFSEALKLTELDDRMQAYRDYEYVPKRDTDPQSKYYGYTAFCEPDDVFHANGIYTIDDLYARCKEWYPDADDKDFTSERNALWQFMAYHLMDRKLLYTRAVCFNVFVQVSGNLTFSSEVLFRPGVDRNEYYETMQGTLMKISRPLSNSTKGVDENGQQRSFRGSLILNYAKNATDKADPFHSTCGDKHIPVNVLVMNPQDITADIERYPQYCQEALNGSILLINNLLVYNDDVMLGHVLNETIRENVIGLFPELTNNNVRWSGECFEKESIREGLSIPDGYCKDIKFLSEGISFNISSPTHVFQRFQGDIITVNGSPDLAIRLPHVPAGTYEIRIGYPSSNDLAIAQCYVDNEITGIPVDMSMPCDNPLIGWIKDSDTEDNGIANDKHMKNRGYLKGPTCFECNTGENNARNVTGNKRLVLTTKYLSSGDHWLRFKCLSDNNRYLIFNYFELVPVGWLRNESISLEEKRW